MYLYIIYESGLDENEWWFLETCETESKARKYVEEIRDEDITTTKYRIVRYVKEEIIFED